MFRLRRLWAALAICLLTVSAAAPAVASSRYRPGGVLPAEVFAPYFETYAGHHLAAVSRRSGAEYLTLAFLQTRRKRSCKLTWDGDPDMPVAWLTFGPGISRIRAAGGDVIASFGGYTADHGWTDIADSCTSARAVAKAYEKVITTYQVTRLDLGVEDNSLRRQAAVDRRNRAIRLVQRWAARHHRTVEFVYTLPTSTSGLGETGLRVLRSAVRNHARIKVVNIMTFDYFDGEHHEMADDTKSAARGLVAQLHQIHPHMSAAERWAKVGVTEMIGIDDFGSAETFTVSDAKAVKRWATTKHLAELSFWALQRDNGGCPGTKGRDSCSGLAQSRWRFSNIFTPFTHG
jgi:chitinase